MDSIHDLEWIMNDYFRLKELEIARQSISHQIALSMGPTVEQVFRNMQVRKTGNSPKDSTQ